MEKIIWFASAVKDVVRLREFLAEKNTVSAKKAAQAIHDAANRLLKNPFIGKPIANLPSYRDLLARFGSAGYVIRYRARGEVIYIVHVRHYRESDFK